MALFLKLYKPHCEMHDPQLLPSIYLIFNMDVVHFGTWLYMKYGVL